MSVGFQVHVDSHSCLSKVVDAKHRGNDILAELIKDKEFPHGLMIVHLRQSVIPQRTGIFCRVEIQHSEQRLALNLSQRRRSTLLW